MNKLINFNDFMFNKILEELNVKVNELELILSPKFKKTLSQINHQISDDLLELHKNSDRVFKKTFVDVGSQPDKVSFIQSNKVPELIDDEIVHGSYIRTKTEKEGDDWTGEFDIVNMGDWKNPWISDVEHVIDLHDIQFTNKEHPVWNKFRSEVKIGRFISQMFPGKYSLNKKRDEQLSKPNDIESFVNMYIATIEANSKKIVEVNGDDIKHYYDCDNYNANTGTLGGSCMKDVPSEYFDIYSVNENVSLLILYPEDIRDKIIGRAILWKIDSIDGEKVNDAYFMDRIYTTKDSDEFMFIEYAKKQGYYYKSIQKHGDYKLVEPDGSEKYLNIEVQLKPSSYGHYPYMDTLRFYNPETGIITNNSEYFKPESGFGKLESTSGDIDFYE